MDRVQLISYLHDVFDAVEHLSDTSGALTSYITSNNKDIDDAYWDTLDQIKDGEFDTPEDAADALIEIFG